MNLGFGGMRRTGVLFGRDWCDYLGRLCTFATCPKGKRNCLVPGCGKTLFLQQHEDFHMHADALCGDRSLLLYERGRGILARAAELPAQEGGA